MKISTKGRYAIRLLIEIGMKDDEFVKLKDAAKKQDISLKYLEQISSSLQKAGLVISSRGANGGYKLAKKAEEYSILEILEVTEGNLAVVSCLEDEKNQCDRYRFCSTIELWEGLNKAIKGYLEGKNLKELIEKEKKNSRNEIDYYI